MKKILLIIGLLACIAILALFLLNVITDKLFMVPVYLALAVMLFFILKKQKSTN